MGAHMSGIPSDGGPPHHGCKFDHSYNETSYGEYINQGQQATRQGTINNITTIYQNNTPNPLEELEQLCSHNAAFDSAARFVGGFGPPRCAESTRLGIIRILEEWVNSGGDHALPSSIFWLHGGAGVGKSALAQSLSERYKEKKQLGASFFFFRSDEMRNNGNHLIPTLVFHLVSAIEGFGRLVEASIRENQAVFTKNHQVQIQQLLIEPLLALKSQGALVTHPLLIVIDGLDECENRDIQCSLLRVIARSVPGIPIPLRFLVTSRPEAHIVEVFEHDPNLQAIQVHRYNLSDDPDANTDIRQYLGEEFEKIRQVHRVRRYLPHDWPNRGAINSLVERSSGHFIYASTVIRYIQSSKHRPDNRLEVILRLRPPQNGDRPYAQLDVLYEFIFLCAENDGQLETICLVLGILYFGSTNTGFFANFGAHTTIIEELLDLEAGDLELLLDPILSLIAIDNGDKIRILHKSLFDYLLDPSRCRDLPFDLRRVHELAATRILKQSILKNICNTKDFQVFAYHCRYGYLNHALKGYLHSLEVPCPKSVATIPKTFPSWGTELNKLLQSVMWNFFRMLSREDSTAQIYEQYVAKWTGYLHSAVIRKQRQARPPSKAVIDKRDGLKLKLDTLLVQWQPQDSNLMNLLLGAAPDAGVQAIAEQEHHVFSAYAKASFYGNTNVIASSLVFGDCFIHSYHFGIQGQDTFMILQTYSIHGNRSYQGVFSGPFIIDDVALSYLKSAEKYLCSDVYQQYGIEPES